MITLARPSASTTSFRSLPIHKDKSLFPFSMAFQPIVDTSSGTAFAYESLVRGPAGEPALSALEQVNRDNRHLFDETFRVRAIELAAHLGVARQGARLSMNLMPGAVYSPTAGLDRTLRTARDHGFPVETLIFEITDARKFRNLSLLQGIVQEYRRHGVSIALDDFDPAFSHPTLLEELGADFVKLDAKLIRNLDTHPAAEDVIRSIVDQCAVLDIGLIGECVETVEEYAFLRDCGVDLMQGFLFAKPVLEALPEIAWPPEF